MNPLLALAVVVVSSVAVHELAHVAASRLVGHDVFEIQFGAGPTWSLRLGDTRFGLGLLPLGGHVQTGSPRPDGFRWRSTVVAGSGVTANLALAGVGGLVGADQLVGFNLLVVAANLWPGGRRRMGEHSSDGRRLLDLLRGDADALAEERSGWYCVRAMRAQEAGDIEAAREIVERGTEVVGQTRAILAVTGLVAFEQARHADVVAAYAPLIADDRVSVAGRAGFAADAAWAACRTDDPALQALAVPWAEFALRVRRTDRRRRILDEARACVGDEGARR